MYRSRQLVEPFFHIILPLSLLVTELFFFPYWTQFEVSNDEGVNLMKSMLMDNGYKLYSQIWSDQPPLFSYLLAGVMRIFGYGITPARMLVLFFSCILIWAAIQIMRLLRGNGVALTSAILIFLLPRYFIFSNAVMIGIPSIALGMLSLLFLVYWHRQKKWIWLILSAVALALSVMTKLFTGLLAPIFLIGLVADEYYQVKATGKPRMQILIPVTVWCVTFGMLGLGSIFWLVGSENIPQLFQFHLIATQAIQYTDESYSLGWYFSPTQSGSYHI